MNLQRKGTGVNIFTSTLILLKPGIILSVGFTGFTGMVLANRGIPSLELLLIGLASLLLSAAGAAILNNLLDRRIDTHMNRLSKRVEALQIVGGKTALTLAIIFILTSLFLSFRFINTLNGILTLVAI